MCVCQQCGSSDVFEAPVTLPAGLVYFVHCRTCEYRCWTDESRLRILPVEEVVAPWTAIAGATV